VEVVYSLKAVRDLEYWRKFGNKRIQKKITDLIEDTVKHPFVGIGKPEALKESLSGLWSRRINREHRMIYMVTGKNKLQILSILSLKGHYAK
jgi:toxin YoeB